jgi:hypothetical protein
MSVDLLNLGLGILQTLILFVGAIWTYLRFFKEGTHRPRIEMDISYDILQESHGFRALAFRVSATNHGNVDFRFSDLRFRVRGALRGMKLMTKDIDTLTGKTPYIQFSEGDQESHSLIPRRSGYFFVRPHVTQHFSYCTMVPVSWAMVSARASFKYPTTNELHTAERVFSLERSGQSNKTHDNEMEASVG